MILGAYLDIFDKKQKIFAYVKNLLYLCPEFVKKGLRVSESADRESIITNQLFV
jgi:hypothetical protein